jgi:phosphoribosylformylglycinamidine cyclo-ligase
MKAQTTSETRRGLNILIIGCGARESAMIDHLLQFQENNIFGYIPYCHPAFAGRIEYRIFSSDDVDFKECYDYCKEKDIRYVVIGSENYIKTGLGDYLEGFNEGITCISPSTMGAQIETSKYFARKILDENHLSKYNPNYILVNKQTPFVNIQDFIEVYNNNVVVKANGLYSGKGVKVYGIDMFSKTEILDNIYTILKKNDFVVLERRIQSQNEFSLISFTDSETTQHSFPIKDFKRLHDENRGPNTGSMGCIYDGGTLKYLTPELIQEAKTLNSKVIEILNTKGYPYKGMLYGSYIVDSDGKLKVIEFNCRFGDPESIIIMKRLETNFGKICHHIAEKTLDQLKIRFRTENPYAICKYIVPSGYPTLKTKDFPLTITEGTKNPPGSEVAWGAVKSNSIGTKYYGKSSRTLVVYSENIISIAAAESEVNRILKEMMRQNPDKLHYRKHITKDYDNEPSWNTKTQKTFSTLEKIKTALNPLVTDSNRIIDLEFGDEDLINSDEEGIDGLDRKTDKLIRNTVNKHLFPQVAFNSAYANSGVNVNLANKAVQKIGNLVATTHDDNILGRIGGFGGLYDMKYINTVCLNPVLVTSIDGVGTKSIFSVEHYELDGFEMLGQDIVNHCVNDILVQGAYPLFFADYFASSVLNEEQLYYFIKGVTYACKQNKCALIGGETAEMPNTYERERHDLVGNIVGVVDKHDLIDGKAQVNRGDVMVSLASSGPHTNGFSLIRKIYNENKSKFTPEMIYDLCVPHRSYLKEYQQIENNGITVHGMAHITGGGIRDNIMRVIPDGMEIELYPFTYAPLFKQLQKIGNVSKREMEQVFNCGIGMVFIVSENEVERLTEQFSDSQVIGRVI